MPIRSATRARQDIAENSEAGAEHGFRLELPRNRRSRLQNGQRRGREQIAEMSLNGGVQRLIDIMRDGTEGAAKTGDLIMRIQRIGVEGVAQTERPGQCASHFPGVLRVDIEIEKVEGLICVRRERLRRGVRYSIDKLLQVRVGHGGNRAFSEVVVVQAEDTGIGSEPQFVSATAPGEVVVDEKAGCAPALNPGVVQPSDGREGIRAAALQHDRERRKCLLKVAWPKQALVPGERRIEVVHQVLREDVRVSCRERIERLRGKRIEHRVDGVRVRGLQTGVRLKTKPGRVFLVDVVVDAGRLHLLVVVAGVRNALPVGATVHRRRADNRRIAVGCAAGISIEREHLLIERDQLRTAELDPQPSRLPAEAVKTYCWNAAVGTIVGVTMGSAIRTHSLSKKKKSLSCAIGPPRLPPK